MKNEIVPINLEYDFKKYIDALLKSCDNLYKLFHSINVHKQTKMTYQNINGRIFPVMNTFSSDALLLHYSKSLKYKLDSLYFQSLLLRDIILISITKLRENSFLKENDKSFIGLQISTLFDNLIIHTLSLIEYALTFISHFYCNKIINNWTNFYSSIRQNRRLEVFKEVFAKYNKSVIAFKEYRNQIIHKNMNGLPIVFSKQLMTGKVTIELGFCPEILKMCKKLNFESNLDYSNSATLHYTISLEFLNFCSEIFEVVFKDLFDENMRPKHYGM